MSVQKEPLNIIIAGVGGQGNVLASQVLGHMLVAKGKFVTIGETYGASQRGGAVMSHIRISSERQYPPLIPIGQCDLLIALEPVEAIRIIDRYGNPWIRTLVNTRTILPISVLSGDAEYPDVLDILDKIKELSNSVWMVDATEIALKIGDPIWTNMVMIGALSELEFLPFDRLLFLNTIRHMISPSILDKNMEAFDSGAAVIQGQLI
jgi:indolepyruvate ferredoxin oxidoreductase beta subunit